MGVRFRLSNRMNKIGLIARRPIQNILIRFSSQKFTHDYDAMVNANKCVVFMKGTPEAPNCGFSRAVIQVLEAEGADFKEIDTHNILADEIMREELKEYSDWPTFPRYISKVNSLQAVILCTRRIKK